MTTTMTPFETQMPGFFRDFRQEMDSLMNRFFEREGNGHDLGTWFTPLANVCETEQNYEITLDLPGVNPDEVNVEFKQGDLWITGERKEESEEKDRTWHRVERRYGQFRRVMRLGQDVDAEKIDAEFHDGVLKVTVPKTEGARARRIEIKK